MANYQEPLAHRSANLETMVKVSRAISSAFDLPSLLKEIVRSAVELVQCEKSSILLLSPEESGLCFAAVSGTDFAQVKDVVVPRHGSIAGTIAETRKPLIIHDAQRDPRLYREVDQLTGQSTHSVLGVPLEIGGRIIGVLQALNKKQDIEFDEDDVKILLIFASQAAAAIENTRLIEEQRQRLTEVLLLQEVLLTLSRFIEIAPLLDQLLGLLAEWLGYAKCAILLYHSEQRELHLTASCGFAGAEEIDLGRAENKETLAERVVKTQKPLYVPRVAQETDLITLSPSTQAALSVPMICGEDVDLVGVISVESDKEGFFNDRDLRILSTIAAQAAIGVRQAQLYEKSQRANQLKQEFIATMSHELRTPLAVLIGYCDLLRGETLGQLSGDQKEAVSVIRDRADLLLRLLNDVLDFSRIVSGDLQLATTVVNLSRAVRSTVDKHQEYADRKEQTISTDIPHSCLYVVADEQRLRQVIGHLLDNAIKFSSKHRPIQIRAQPYEGGYVRVDVSDHGIGIKPEYMGVIFEDFRQADSSFTREYGGAGLGLAISRRLVALQGGVLWAESEYGKGSTFSFILPRAGSSAGLDEVCDAVVPGSIL